MSFSLRCKVPCEFRGITSGTGQNGSTWMRMKCEYEQDGDLQDLEVSVPKDLQSDLYNAGLRKADMVLLDVTARAGSTRKGESYSYVQLNNVPRLIDDDGVLE